MINIARHVLFILLIAILFLSITSLGKTASAQGGIELFQCYTETINLTYSFEQLGSLSPGYEVFYTYNFTSPGSLNITLSPKISSSQPLELVVIEKKSGQYLYRSSSSTSLSFTYTLNLTAPISVEIGVYNSGQLPADYYGEVELSMCGSPAVARWISENIVVQSSSLGPIAPVGIADYGAMLLAGQASFYRISTSSVRGIANISGDVYAVYAVSYYNNGTYAFPGFSVQLNAFLLVKLVDGRQQIYWLQNTLDWENIYGLKLGYVDNIWNATSSTSSFTYGRIHGNGEVYFTGRKAGEQYYAYGEKGTLQIGTHELIISTQNYGGSLMVKFIIDGNSYDSVTIIPYAPVLDAKIVVDPSMQSGYGVPLDLELVLAGFSGEEPIALLSKGGIQLSLFYNVSGRWAPPFSAWSVGAATFEKAIAKAIGISNNSALVVQGEPSSNELWSSAVVVITPYGIFLQNNGNISYYLKEIDLGNSTKLVEPVAYVNGEILQGNIAPLGSIVLINYTREYLVNLSSSIAKEQLWVHELTPLKDLANETVNISPVTRLVLEAAYVNGIEADFESYLITGPVNISLVYVKEFLIEVNSTQGRKDVWVKEGESPTSIVPAKEDLGNGTALILTALYFNGDKIDLQSFRITSPGNLSAIYSLAYQVKLIGPENITELWVISGSQLNLTLDTVIYLGNNTRLVLVNITDSDGRKITFPIIVASPIEIKLNYEREYFVNIESYSGWFPEGQPLNISRSILLKQGKSFVYSYIVILELRYIETPNGPISPDSTVSGPITGKAIYSAVADIRTEFLGTPNIFSLSIFSCGSQSNQSLSFLSSRQLLTIENPNSLNCSAEVPISLPLPVSIIIVVAILGIVISQKIMKR